MNRWFRSRSQESVRWTQRLENHSRWLKTVILARSGEADAIEEIFQEVALAAIRQNPQVADPQVAPWLYRVAVRQALLHRRRQGRQRRLRQRFASDPSLTVEAGSDPLVWLLADERRILIRQAISRLHSKDAELLLLKYTEDWSCHDLADHLGISHSAVEARLHRARQRLRAALIALEVLEPAQ